MKAEHSEGFYFRDAARHARRIARVKDDNFYVGYTTDLPRRLDEHFQGHNTSTAPRRPFVLVHCEYYLAKADAERRENYLKTAKGRRVLRLMLEESLTTAKA